LRCWLRRSVGWAWVVGWFVMGDAAVLPRVVGQEAEVETGGPGRQTAAAVQDETPIFSGPQVGEVLPSFVFRELLVEPMGRELDLVTKADGGPLLLLFVHEVNRPTVGFTRVLTGYGRSRSAAGLQTGVVFLAEDVTTGEADVKRIQHALTPEVPTGVALEGREGPGSYGLNRHVSLTIVVAREGQVVANFALVQPSLQVDLPRVLESLVAMLGGPMPTLAELEALGGPAAMAGRTEPARPTEPGAAPNLRPLLQPLIRRDATEAAVQRAAEAVEQAAAKDEAVRQEVQRIATTIVRAGVVENYGTPAAQAYLRKWAAEAEGRQEREPLKP